MKDFVHSLLEKSRWPVLLFVLAGLVTLLAYYQPSRASLTELQFDRTDPPAYGLLVLAAGLALTGGFLLIRSPSPPGRYRAKVEADGDDISTCIGQCKIAITYGRLEEASAEHREAVLVVLPANEYFDDECINDSHSALGAFVQGRLRDAQADFQAALDTELQTVPAVQTDPDGRRHYPLGTGVYLKGHAHADGGHLLVAAATEQLPEGGLRGDLKALFSICRQAYRTARNARLDHVMMPLIGAGHGSIGPARALLGLLLAWCEIFYRDSGYRMTVTIVVFKADKVEPAIGRDDAKELLSIAAGVTSPVN